MNTEDNSATMEAPPTGKRGRGPNKQPRQQRRNYQAEFAALRMKVDIGRKLLCGHVEKLTTPDHVLSAVLELLTE